MGDKTRRVLAANLNALMKKAPGLRTIPQLNARSGVSTGTIDRIRRAAVSAGVDNLDALADAFGVTPRDLLTEGFADQVTYRTDGSVVILAAASAPSPNSDLVRDFDELLPEEQAELRAAIAQKAEQMRKHAQFVLQRAGVQAPASAQQVAHIKPAPPWPGPDRRKEDVPVEHDRRRGSMLDLGGGQVSSPRQDKNVGKK